MVKQVNIHFRLLEKEDLKIFILLLVFLLNLVCMNGWLCLLG